jgi:hypothetical protein
MKLKTSRIILLVCGIALFSAAVSAYLYHSKGKTALDKYRSKLLANGEKLKVSEVLPRPVAPEQNSLATFQAANRLLGQHRFFDTNAPTAMRSVKPGKAMIAWAQPDVRDQKTNTWEECQTAAAAERELTELLEGIIDRPVIDFHLDYGQGFTLLLPHLAPLKRCAQHLSIGAICDLQRGDTVSAVIKIRAILAIAKGMENERLIISQLVRIAIANIAVAATWELLQSPNATDDQLGLLQSEWTKADFLQGCENAVTMERAMCEAATARMHQSSDEFRNYATMFSRNTPSDWLNRAANSALLKTKESMWRFAWSDPDELRMLRGEQIILETLRVARTNFAFAPLLRDEETRLAALGLSDRKNDSEGGLPSMDDIDISTMMSQSVLSIKRFPQRVYKNEAARQLAIAALALKRHQLRHGTYPARLTEMTPEILVAVPHDPVDGKPLRYRLNSDGTFTLYSIGEDERDDSGDPRPESPSKSTTWLQGRDWVWPQPATADEVKMFYEKEAATRAGSRALAEFEKRYGLVSTNQQLPVTNH